jgi:plasmid stabilization system protein ParE
MYSVLILEEGLEDLRNLVAYIASENPSAAETLGRRGLLKLVHGNYLIYHRVDEQKQVVEIVALKHGAQIK